MLINIKISTEVNREKLSWSHQKKLQKLMDLGFQLVLKNTGN